MRRTTTVRSRLTTPVLTVAVTGLLVAGCTGDEPTGDDTASASTPSPTAPSLTAPSPTAPSPTAEQPPVVPTTELPDLDARCTLEPDLPQINTIRYSVPSDWRVEDRCDVLDPDLEDLPNETDAAAAIFVNTARISFREAAEPDGASRVEGVWPGARAGYQANRTTAVSTGEALTPEGRPSTSYLVDLDAGADDQGGVLTMTTGVPEGEGYTRAQAALDAIAGTVVIDPPAQDAAADGFAVLRQEGGGTPSSVTFDGACFRLRPGSPNDEATAELCDVDPQDRPLVAEVLGDDTVVGYAPATAIGVEGDPGEPTSALTASIEGGTVFALRVSEVPDQLTAIGPGGEELTTGDVG